MPVYMRPGVLDLGCTPIPEGILRLRAYGPDWLGGGESLTICLEGTKLGPTIAETIHRTTLKEA